MADGLAGQRRTESGGSQRLQAPLQSENLLADIAEVLLCKPNHAGIIVQRREDIDEPEELRLERVILHGQIDGGLRPPTAVEKTG